MPAKMNQIKDKNKKDLIPKSFLQSGNPLKITNDILFKHPKVQEIMDIDKETLGLYSERIYYSMINIFLTDPYDYMVYLDNNGIDYEEITSFDLFCMLFKDYNNNFIDFYNNLNNNNANLDISEIHIYFKSFKFFTGIEKFFISKDNNGKSVLGYGNNKFLMDEEIYNYVSEFVRKINGISETDKIYPSNKWSKEILIEDEREKLKRKKNNIGNNEDSSKNKLGDMLSSITWCSNGNISPYNRNNLYIYDLIEGIQKTDKLYNYKNTMTGLYSGCIDKKNINIKEIHWSTD